ncbi:DNA-directed RNA polymerases I, II, and III subunit RPABC3 [Taxawa tesnikishii (nom. ined.)]|nr:DNA-directed RNA polymerases I, II, and III subunit RPABC3 [Dothideales sp. JES 119]
MADSQLYEESFSITSVNSQKYDRVSRIAGSSSDMQTVMSLDVNSDLYPLQTGEGIQMLLASTLNLDGTKDERGWRDTKGTHEATLADMWDYVCYGKVYRKVYISFGGLLLYLEGPYKKLTPLRIDYVYLLLKK